ncbi:histidine kinase [Phytomonospora sp. NPDC050363]|uniref:sensor histidine kinase n=1 Tax=Phytomonospora sp. NPDC050363 TaxID=3155642 RepID=UPI0033CCFDB8
MSASPDRPHHRDLLVAALLAVILGVPSVVMLVIGASGPWQVGASVAALAVAHAGALWRRARPWPAFVAVAAAFACLVWATGMFVTLPSALVFPFALYSACAHGSRALALAVPVVVLTGAAGGALRLGTDPATARSGALPMLGVVFAAFAGLLAVAAILGLWRRAQLAYAEQRAHSAAMSERARIAREMHDVVAHSLAVIVSQANGGRYAARTEPETAAEVLGTIARTAKAALADTRGLLGVLDAPGAGSGPATPPQPTLAGLAGLVDRARSAGLPVTSGERGDPRELSPAAELAVYRLAQEALTNTLRHAAPGTRADLRLEWDADALSVLVEDRCADQVPAHRTRPRAAAAGRGIRGMRSRFQALGGSVEAAHVHGGFDVHGRLPYGDSP